MLSHLNLQQSSKVCTGIPILQRRTVNTVNESPKVMLLRICWTIGLKCRRSDSRAHALNRCPILPFIHLPICLWFCCVHTHLSHPYHSFFFLVGCTVDTFIACIFHATVVLLSSEAQPTPCSDSHSPLFLCLQGRYSLPTVPKLIPDCDDQSWFTICQLFRTKSLALCHICFMKTFRVVEVPEQIYFDHLPFLDIYVSVFW